MSFDINGSVLLVTGANGGLGREWVRQSLERGAKKVYATDIALGEWNDERVVPLVLDVTDEASIAAVAETAPDVTFVINNAGIPLRDPLSTGDPVALHRVFEVDFFGAVAVARHLTPIVVGNGGGALLNVISVLSWVSVAAGYSAAKSALWSATNALRLELTPQGILVSGLHMGYTDTPMTKALDVPKNDPADVVFAGLEGVQAGEEEILADDIAAQVKSALSGPIRALYPQLETVDS